MKKIFLTFCVVLLLMPIVFAKLELEEIRVYLNDKRYSDADKSGGDIDVKREDKLELMVFLQNNMDNKTRVRLKGIIESIKDGDDLVDEEDWYDIEKNDDKSKTLTFFIPKDSSRDSYDMELTIYYEYANNTEKEMKVEWDVMVEIDERTETELEITLEEIKKMIQNINCSDQFNQGEEYYKLYLNCFTNYTICDSYKKENQKYESDYRNCISLQNSYEEQNRKWYTDYYLLNGTYTNCIIARDNYSGQRVFYPFIVAIICIGGTYLYLKKGGSWRRKGKMATDKYMTQPPDTRPSIHDIKERINPQKSEGIPNIRELEKRG